MITPSWLGWLLTAAMLAVVVHGVVRFAVACRTPEVYSGTRRASDVAQILMGAGMAVMCSPVGGPLPMAGWQTVFLVIATWSAGSWYWRQREERRCQASKDGWPVGPPHHAVAAAAMLYMLVAMPHGTDDTTATWTSHQPDAAIALPAVSWALAGYFLVTALVLWSKAGLSAASQVLMALCSGYLFVVVT